MSQFHQNVQTSNIQNFETYSLLTHSNHPGKLRALREVFLVAGKCYEIAPLWYIGEEFYKF